MAHIVPRTGAAHGGTDTPRSLVIVRGLRRVPRGGGRAETLMSVKESTEVAHAQAEAMTDREHIEKEKLRLSRAAWPYEDITPTDLALAVAAAVRREERERCAVICETLADSHPSGIGPTSRGGVAIDCAAAIRSAVPLQPSAETCAHHATVAV